MCSRCSNGQAGPLRVPALCAPPCRGMQLDAVCDHSGCCAAGHWEISFGGGTITADKTREAAADSVPLAGSQLARTILLNHEDVPVPPDARATWFP